MIIADDGFQGLSLVRVRRVEYDRTTFFDRHRSQSGQQLFDRLRKIQVLVFLSRIVPSGAFNIGQLRDDPIRLEQLPSTPQKMLICDVIGRFNVLNESILSFLEFTKQIRSSKARLTQLQTV